MHQTLLSVENLNISFNHVSDKPLKIVDDISFTISQEDVVGLVGESGCGKTLTALSIMKLLPSNAICSGKVLFKGENLLALEDRKLRNIRGQEISMIFQEPMTSLNPVFTVGYQIAEALMTHKNMNKKAALEETIRLLRDVKIPSPELRAKEYPHQMSGGMRQRIMIAMAIACSPSLLIADEPTTALDVTIQAQILELLGSLKEKNKMSILLITHDLGIVAEWVHRVKVMYAGRIVEEADVREVFINPRHPYTIGLFESLPGKKGEALTPIPGQVPKMDELPAGCKFSPRCRYVIKECHEKEPALISVTPPVTTLIKVMTRRGGEGEFKHLSRCIRAMEI